jgi:pheromone shutdown-related protein TraB
MTDSDPGDAANSEVRVEAEQAPGASGGPGEGSVHLVGTAHVSADSVAEVEEVVDQERPDVVAVELDEGRYRQMQGETPDDLDPGDLLKGSVVFQLLAYWLLSYVQARMGDRFDVEPGADMKAAVDAAEATGAGVALVDRDIQTTIQRFWARMRFREKVRLVWELVRAVLGVGAAEEEGAEFEMSELTDADVVTALIEELRRFSPGGAEALIDERDAFIAHRLVALREAGYHVVAVVGAGHREGIAGYLRDPETLPPMEDLVGSESRRFSLGKALGVVLTVGFLAFFVLLAMAGVGNAVLFRVFAAWFLFNGFFAFVLATVAGAHWTSAAVGGAVAWLTSLNPLLAPGWFAGYLELRRRPVNVADINTLNELLSDQETPVGELLGKMLDVPLFRLIAVVAMTNIGSIAASLLFPFLVLPLLGTEYDSVGDVTRLMSEGIGRSIDIVVGLL